MLSIVLCLACFVGCSKKEADNVSSDLQSSKSQDTTSSGSEAETDVSSDPYNETTDENTETDDLTGDTWDEDESEDLSEELIVYNSTPLNKNFRGIQAVYQLYKDMPQKYNLTTYTDEQWEYESNFFKTMGIDTVRSFYGPSLAYDSKTGGYNWNSEGMIAFYNNCLEMEKMGIEVGITPQWSFEGFVNEESGNTYKHCTDLYFTGYTDADSFDKTMQEHRKFIKNSVLQFKAHGVNNIKCLFAYTEVNNTFTNDETAEQHPEWDNLQKRQYDKLLPLYDKAITALDAGLKDSGLRSNYKIVGPCDAAGYDDYSHMVKYCLENLSDKIDIIGSHFGGYSKANELVLDDFYWPVVDGYTAEVEQVVKSGKEYWVDEFNASQESGGIWGASRAKINNASPWRGVAISASLNGVMNSGAGGTFIWQIFENFWPSMGTSPGTGTEPTDYSEFFGGIQFGGYIPNFNESVMPYYGWYALSLITRYVDRGTTYSCEVGDGIYLSCIERTDGEWTVVVTNYNYWDTAFSINFEKSLGGKTFYRYLYDTETVQRSVGDEMIHADAVARNVTTCINDELPACSVAVYTTVTD